MTIDQVGKTQTAEVQGAGNNEQHGLASMQTMAWSGPQELALTSSSSAGSAGSSAENNWIAKLGRVGDVGVDGLGYSVIGFKNAMVSDLSSWHNVETQLAPKVAGGLIMGAAFRALLPAGGVGKAVAGTIMLGYMLKDMLAPVANAVHTAWDTSDKQKLNTAAQKMGTGLGQFGWDSVVGIGAGKLGEIGAGAVMKSRMGSEGLASWEASKNQFFNEKTGLVGRFLVPASDKIDSITGKVHDSLLKLKPEEQTRLSGPEALAKVKAVADSRPGIMQAPMYRRADFSDMIDAQLAGEPQTGAVSNPTDGVTDGAPLINRTRSGYLLNLRDGGKRVPGDASPTPPDLDPADTPVNIPSLGDKGGKRVPGDASPAPPESDPADTPVTVPSIDDQAGKPTSAGTSEVAKTGDSSDATDAASGKIGKLTPQDEFSPDVMKKLAEEAAARQAKWDNPPEDPKTGTTPIGPAALADFRDAVKAPTSGISDATRSGRMVGPEFDRSAQDISALADEVHDQSDMDQVQQILKLHQLAASQIETRQPLTQDLNNLARHFYGIWLQGMRSIGVQNNVLDGKVPSVVAVADDEGAGNFTFPAIDKVLRRPVTLFPRNQTELSRVLADIDAHEQEGHDHVFPEIARFPEAYRKTVLTTAVENAMKKNNIENTTIKLGDTSMKKSQLLVKLLMAEANENTADIAGTAVTGVGTPSTLGILLQSIRRGGVLETRNVYGSQFPETFEPHGLDTWRIRLSAEVMRYLSGNDKDVSAYADALDNYANKAGHPSSDYVFASLDTKGETVKISQKEWDAVIPEIVKAQFETPLDSLKTPKGNATLRDVLAPGFTDRFHKTQDLAGKIAEAITSGKTQIDNFDPDTFRNTYDIGNLSTAGTLAWAKAVAAGAPADTSLDALNKIAEPLWQLYRESNPHEVPLEPTTIDQFKQAPISTTVNSIANMTGRVIGNQPRVRTWIGDHAVSIGGAGGSLLGADLLNLWKTQQELMPAAATAEQSGSDGR